MPGKRLTPDQISQAVALREAGYSLVATAERLGVSVSSLQRVYKRHGTRRGALHDEVVQDARDALLRRLSSDAEVTKEAARLVADDLAHSRLLREKAAMTMEALTPSDTASAALTMRALVAYSTLLKNTADTLRDSLGITPRGIHSQGTAESLPELTIREMTAPEIKALVDGTADRAVHDAVMDTDDGTVDGVEHSGVDYTMTES